MAPPIQPDPNNPSPFPVPNPPQPTSVLSVVKEPIMNKLPAPMWAVALAVLGCLLCIAVLFKPDPNNIAIAILAIASNLVSGALGAFAGHAQSANSLTQNGDNAVINPPSTAPSKE